MATYSISELARAAGTTVRNVRAYQSKQLLPSPERDGRHGDRDAALRRISLSPHVAAPGQ